MKIWVIGRGVPQKRNRMLGQFELGQAKMLSKGNEVVYIAQAFTCRPKYAAPGFFFRCAVDEGVRVFSRTVLHPPGKLGIQLKRYTLYHWKRFLQRIEEKTGLPDVIHIHYPAMICDPEVLLRYKQRGVKIVCTEHWSRVMLGKLNNRQLERLRGFYAAADAFLCVGELLRQAVEACCGADEKLVVVPNVVADCFNYRPRMQAGGFHFIAVGRFAPEKQFDKIVTAFAAAFGGNDAVRLTIVGDGSERELVQQTIRKNGVDRQVRLTGVLSRDEVAEAVASADCLVCYSSFETFGVPVIEAWACGLPVIAADSLGFSADWDDARGLVVSHRDIQALKEAMQTVAAQYALYDRQKIAEYAKKTYSEAAIYKRLMDVYAR